MRVKVAAVQNSMPRVVRWNRFDTLLVERGGRVGGGISNFRNFELIKEIEWYVWQTTDQDPFFIYSLFLSARVLNGINKHTFNYIQQQICNRHHL